MAENKQHTEIAKAAAAQMTKNQGPGQANGNKQGLTQVKITNPKAQHQMYNNGK